MQTWPHVAKPFKAARLHYAVHVCWFSVSLSTRWMYSPGAKVSPLGIWWQMGCSRWFCGWPPSSCVSHQRSAAAWPAAGQSLAVYRTPAAAPGAGSAACGRTAAENRCPSPWWPAQPAGGRRSLFLHQCSRKGKVLPVVSGDGYHFSPMLSQIVDQLIRLQINKYLIYQKYVWHI